MLVLKIILILVTSAIVFCIVSAYLAMINYVEPPLEEKKWGVKFEHWRRIGISSDEIYEKSGHILKKDPASLHWRLFRMGVVPREELDWTTEKSKSYYTNPVIAEIPYPLTIEAMDWIESKVAENSDSSVVEW